MDLIWHRPTATASSRMCRAAEFSHVSARGRVVVVVVVGFGFVVAVAAVVLVVLTVVLVVAVCPRVSTLGRRRVITAMMTADVMFPDDGRIRVEALLALGAPELM